MRLCVGCGGIPWWNRRTTTRSSPAEQAAKLESALKAVEIREVQAPLIPAGCGRYEQVLAKALACDKIPQDVRDGLAKRFADQQV
ncbi:MAG: hypothetical protein IPQ07_14605 [Myxococcales bacterium]|nr:hypothetical protein [Myxococcales bacterium]